MFFKWLILAVILLTTIGVIWFLRKKQKDQDKPIESIVLLLKQPKLIDIHILANLLTAATGKTVKAFDVESELKEEDKNKPAGDFVLGVSPHFMAQIAQTMFTVHNLSAPYMNDPIQASESIPELRLRKALRDHKAWLSMDILHSQGSTSDAYRIVGQVLANLVDSDCLALYHPSSNQLVLCSDGISEKLRSEQPINAVFRESTEVPPVIPIDDDPRLTAAEAEARRRFPEFRTAFEKKDGINFAIKTKITRHGNSEHIWVEVDGISDSKIEGQLGNQPVDLADLKLGSKIEIEINQVEDWMFIKNDAPVGMFTVPIIQQIQQERTRQ